MQAGLVGGGGGWRACELAKCKSLEREGSKQEGHWLGNEPTLGLKSGCATLELGDRGHVTSPL